MIRFSSILFWSTLTIAASVGLYHTSYRVHELSQQLHDLNASIEAEQRNIHVLKAEWVYLSNPAKIEQAARKYLSLHPAALQQIAKLDHLPEILPATAESTADVSVTNSPLASLMAPAPVAIASAPQRIAGGDDHAHINTRMIIQHSANASLATGHNGMLLANFGARP